MKFETTRKAIVNHYSKVYSVGYCGAQYLFRGMSPVAYNAGVYGWNFDLYDVGGVAICTGYRNMPGAIAPNVREYESAARAIWEDYSAPYEDRAARAREVLRDFIGQLEARKEEQTC